MARDWLTLSLTYNLPELDIFQDIDPTVNKPIQDIFDHVYGRVSEVSGDKDPELAE